MVKPTMMGVTITTTRGAAKCRVNFDWPADADHDDLLEILTKAYVDVAGKVHRWAAVRDALTREAYPPRESEPLEEAPGSDHPTGVLKLPQRGAQRPHRA